MAEKQEMPSQRALVLYGFPDALLEGVYKDVKEVLEKDGITIRKMQVRHGRAIAIQKDKKETLRVKVSKEVTLIFESEYAQWKAKNSLKRLQPEHCDLLVREALKVEERQAEREEIFSGKTVECYGISTETTPRDLVEFFGRAGPLSSTAGHYDVMKRSGAVDGKGRETYIGVATYEDANSALKAVRLLSGKCLRGIPVQVLLRSSQLVKEDLSGGPDRGGVEMAAFADATKQFHGALDKLSLHLACGVCKDSESKARLMQCDKGHTFCEPCASHKSLTNRQTKCRGCPECRGSFAEPEKAPR